MTNPLDEVTVAVEAPDTVSETEDNNDAVLHVLAVDERKLEAVAIVLRDMVGE